jgi:hypothetical protein
MRGGDVNVTQLYAFACISNADRARLFPGRAEAGAGAVRGAGCGVRGAGCGVRGAGCGVRGAGCGVRGAGCGVRGTSVRGAGGCRCRCGVWAQGAGGAGAVPVPVRGQGLPTSRQNLPDICRFVEHKIGIPLGDRYVSRGEQPAGWGREGPRGRVTGSEPLVVPTERGGDGVGGGRRRGDGAPPDACRQGSVASRRWDRPGGGRRCSPGRLAGCGRCRPWRPRRRRGP